MLHDGMDWNNFHISKLTSVVTISLRSFAKLFIHSADF